MDKDLGKKYGMISLMLNAAIQIANMECRGIIKKGNMKNE